MFQCQINTYTNILDTIYAPLKLFSNTKLGFSCAAKKKTLCCFKFFSFFSFFFYNSILY